MPLGFENKMEVGDAQSSSSISEPPDSPPNQSLRADTIRVANPSTSEGVVGPNPNSALSPSLQPATSANGNAVASTTTNTDGTAPKKPKQTRKKK